MLGIAIFAIGLITGIFAASILAAASKEPPVPDIEERTDQFERIGQRIRDDRARFRDAAEKVRESKLDRDVREAVEYANRAPLQ